MSYILIYEPKEGLKYYLQNHLKDSWRWNGLENNAYHFPDLAKVYALKSRFGYLGNSRLIVKEVK